MDEMTFISYPKSGRTWIKYILTLHSFWVQGKDINTITGHDIYSIGKEYNLKFTHMLAGDPPRKADFEICPGKVIYLYRHPLDVMVSYYYEINKRSKHRVKMIKMLVDYLPDMLALHAACMNNLNFKYDRFIFKYEDIKSTKTIQRFFGFLGIVISEWHAERLLNESELLNMQLREASGQFSDHISLRPGNLNDTNSFKCRKGIVGGYRNVLHESEIASALNMMKEYGWPNE